MTQLRLLKLGAILLLLLAISMMALIRAGAFDPKPTGELIWETTLPTTTIPAQATHFAWLDKSLPQQPFSVRLTAVFVEGDLDSGYGLALGTETDTLLVAVSPLGYARIQQNGEAIFPWQPWPHVKTNDTPNEIWIDVAEDQLTVRINRELMWSGALEIPEGELGLYGESDGETDVINYLDIELYGEK